MSCLYLNESDVAQLLDMPLAIEAMQEAFLALAAGQAENVPRARAAAPGIVLHSMSAAAGYLGLVGWKQYTTTRQGARFLIGLYDQQSGELVCLIAADRLGQMRTGAVTGLAARWLALPTADRVGLFGSGWQAESQLAALAAVRPLQQALVYSRDAARRSEFARRMADQLALDVQPVDDPRQAVLDLPVVITATTSRQPVFDGQWLANDVLVCAIGSNWLNKTEIDTTVVQRSQRIVCDSIEGCRREAGDFSQALRDGLFDWSRAVELKEIVERAEPPAGGVQLFKSVGMALEDVALGGKLLERARQVGAGRELELD